jgi:hypothetical protein
VDGVLDHVVHALEFGLAWPPGRVLSGGYLRGGDYRVGR